METALATSGQPVRRGTIAHEHDAYTILADIAAQQRDAAALGQYAQMAEELAARDGHRLYLAIAHRALGVAKRLAGEHSEAEAQLKLALEAFQQMDTHWQAGRTLAEMGELALARANADVARDFFSQALAVFEEMQAAPDAAHVRAALKSLS
jgi:hypothetical protein